MDAAMPHTSEFQLDIIFSDESNKCMQFKESRCSNNFPMNFIDLLLLH